jgi:hypothetical protein
MVRPFTSIVSLAVLGVAAFGCAAGNSDGEGVGGSGTGASGPSTSGSGAGGDGGGFQTTSAGGGEPVGEPVVYGHSRDTLFRLNAETKDVGIVGPFTGCGDPTRVEDIALDANSNLYGTSENGLYRIDPNTAVCTLIASGAYPNSLSFVPKGTVDPNEEALVGYLDDVYVRIDTTTGMITNIGSLGSATLISSGDIVSVKNGPTYLTVKERNNGTTCRDCLVRVNPATGALVEGYGPLGFDRVFGTAFWAGSVYGFTNDGKLFEIQIVNGDLVTTPISTPNGLSFWGAGSTTSAPPVPQ